MLRFKFLSLGVALVSALIVSAATDGALAIGERARAHAGSLDIPTPPTASFTWSMPRRFGPTKNGLVDYHWDRRTRTYESSFINPSSWSVDFDACASAAGAAGIRSYTWEILGERTVRQECKFTYDKFKYLGKYPVKLTVTADDGQTQSYEEEVNVRDIMIVSIGDSFASGQGNPDVSRDPKSKRKVEWIYSRCHRSAKAGPALAALKIEEADPHSSVTFVSYACSGARIDGLTGQQKKGIKSLEPQIDKVRKAVTGRFIDALIVSIGGNDLNFATLVARAIAFKNTHESSRTKELFNSGWQSLPDGFVDLRDAIGKLFPTPKVFITEYPDLVRDSQGNYCNETPGDDRLLKRITGPEAEWASNTVIACLNQEVRQAADRHDWVYIDGIAWNFLQHGYCAGELRWVNTFVDARLIQGTAKCRETSFSDCIVSPGSVHPNEWGHRCFATRMILALQANGIASSLNIVGPNDLCASTPSPLPVKECRAME